MTKKTGETPMRERQARSKQALIASGGKRVAVNLDKQAVEDLDAIRLRSADSLTVTQAIALALRKLAG